MFTRLQEVLGLKRPTLGLKQPDPMAPLLKLLEPKDLPGQIVLEGDPSHPHCFKSVGWDRARLGSDVADFDKDYGTPLEFPMVTCKYLFRCSCGREIVQSRRTLI